MTRARDIASGLGAESGEVVPHIKLDILYPAVAGKLLDGSTSHSGDYGTAQSDGYSYYYTDIKGSKPIKDPRIGAHFGSQRYKTKSLQLLEQETAKHGSNVYSVDGREWLRGVGDISTKNDAQGSVIHLPDTSSYFEVVGYFSDVNYMVYAESNRYVEWTLDGGTESTGNYGNTSQVTPLNGRYVDAGSLIQLSVGATLGIHTLKIRRDSSGNTNVYAIELIAQDTTDTASKSKIQIPAQTVVSYGKKHSISATAQHYDPFNGMSGAKTLAQLGDYIDTGTSLGMENWKAGTANYYKPFNGGRVVKWIDSSGNIKNSVTMMPPNAQNVKGEASNAFSDGEVQAGTNDHTITFDTTTIANATPLSEVAQTFIVREFGNGCGNANNSYEDFTRGVSRNNGDNMAYVMDDGLTSMSCQDCMFNPSAYVDLIGEDAGSDWYMVTFIGTGITRHTQSNPTGGLISTQAINLPYGTHTMVVRRDTNCDVWIDGIELADINDSTVGSMSDVTFHQPKMPPIPQDAVIIADYMLMANFVKQTDAEPGMISKGVRLVGASRDIHYDSSAAVVVCGIDIGAYRAITGIKASAGGSATMTAKLPFFGTTGMYHGYAGNATITLGGSAATETHLDSSAGADGDMATIAETVTLGLTDITATIAVNYNIYAFQVDSPIHTSYHYKDIRGNTGFEDPFLRTLVGGDRNMEQNNLVVTADGKTWDEVTRDTSYIGSIKTMGALDTNQDNANGIIVPTEWRGSATASTNNPLYNKDFAIAYDRLICLVDGQYNITFNQFSNDSLGGWSYQRILINGVIRALTIAQDADWYGANISGNFHLKRGDYVQISGIGHTNEMIYQINRI